MTIVLGGKLLSRKAAAPSTVTAITAIVIRCQLARRNSLMAMLSRKGESYYCTIMVPYIQSIGEPMDITLYYAPITCALAPYITLTEAGAQFEVRPLNFGKGQHTSPEYLKINPKHKVPLLIVDKKVLSESVAIQTWIARTFPQAKLLPADPWQE